MAERPPRAGESFRGNCESALGSTSEGPTARMRSCARRRAARISVIRMSTMRSRAVAWLPSQAIVPAAATGRPSLAFLAAARLRAHDSFALTAVTAGARPRGPVCAEAVARDGRLGVAVVAAWLGERRRNRRRARSQPWSRSRRRGSSPGAATRYQRRGACRARPLRLGGCASGESGQPSHE